jgi:hypothetical protein
MANLYTVPHLNELLDSGVQIYKLNFENDQLTPGNVLFRHVFICLLLREHLLVKVLRMKFNSN